MSLFSEMAHPIGANLSYNLPIIMDMVKLLRQNKFTNLGLVCTGSSGAIIATVIAQQLEKIPLIIYLRKPGENGHSHLNTNNLNNVIDIVVVDDFISTGSTINNIIEQLKQLGKNKAKGLCLSGDYGISQLSDQTFFENYYCLTDDYRSNRKT
jgi:orotate phosphoribosyltransferase-like protein